MMNESEKEYFRQWVLCRPSGLTPNVTTGDRLVTITQYNESVKPAN